MLSQLNITAEGGDQHFKIQADNFVCSILPESPTHQIYISPGMLMLEMIAN